MHGGVGGVVGGAVMLTGTEDKKMEHNKTADSMQLHAPILNI